MLGRSRNHPAGPLPILCQDALACLPWNLKICCVFVSEAHSSREQNGVCFIMRHHYQLISQVVETGDDLRDVLTSLDELLSSLELVQPSRQPCPSHNSEVITAGDRTTPYPIYFWTTWAPLAKGNPLAKRRKKMSAQGSRLTRPSVCCCRDRWSSLGEESWRRPIPFRCRHYQKWHGWRGASSRETSLFPRCRGRLFRLCLRMQGKRLHDDHPSNVFGDFLVCDTWLMWLGRVFNLFSYVCSGRKEREGEKPIPLLSFPIHAVFSLQP